MEAWTITPIEQYVIDRVREYRLEKGMSQRELARLLDLTDGVIGKIETPKERAKYNISQLNEIAKIFKCSIKDFFPDEPL